MSYWDCLIVVAFLGAALWLGALLHKWWCEVDDVQELERRVDYHWRDAKHRKP